MSNAKVLKAMISKQPKMANEIIALKAKCTQELVNYFSGFTSAELESFKSVIMDFDYYEFETSYFVQVLQIMAKYPVESHELIIIDAHINEPGFLVYLMKFVFWDSVKQYWKALNYTGK